MIIYHIVLPAVWERFKNEKSYEAESLETEGFIHCSHANQLDAVLKRYYKDAGKVVILAVETSRLAAKLVEESSTNNEIYPHIYGKLNLDAVVNVSEREMN